MLIFLLELGSCWLGRRRWVFGGYRGSKKGKKRRDGWEKEWRVTGGWMLVALGWWLHGDGFGRRRGRWWCLTEEKGSDEWWQPWGFLVVRSAGFSGLRAIWWCWWRDFSAVRGGRRRGEATGEMREGAPKRRGDGGDERGAAPPWSREKVIENKG